MISFSRSTSRSRSAGTTLIFSDFRVEGNFFSISHRFRVICSFVYDGFSHLGSQNMGFAPQFPHKNSQGSARPPKGKSTFDFRSIVTCLGITIHHELTFADHVKHLISRCFYFLRQFRTVRRGLTTKVAVTLVNKGSGMGPFDSSPMGSY